MRIKKEMLNFNFSAKLQTSHSNYIYENNQLKFFNRSGTPKVRTSYAGNYVYENNSLKFFNHPEGYVEPVIASGSAAISSFEYIYQYKDHLGNIRLSYKDMNHDNEITGFVTTRSTVFEDDFETASGWDCSRCRYLVASGGKNKQII